MTGLAPWDAMFWARATRECASAVCGRGATPWELRLGRDALGEVTTSALSILMIDTGDSRMRPSGDPSDRVLRARLGGYARAAKYDGKEMTAPARRGFDARFEREVDPNNELPPAERARRAEAARKAYFTRLALRSAQSRRKAKEARERAVALDAVAEEIETELAASGGDAA